MKSTRLLTLLLVAVALAAGVAACGGDSDEPAEEEAAPSTQATAAEEDACAKEELQLVNDGQLTVGTDNPAFPPWFVGSDGGPWDPTTEPTEEGFEAAVAYAVAGELGFSDNEVQWTVVPFNQSFKPGPKDFDFDINQISFTPKRAERVSFSESYYDVNQAVVSVKGSAIASATTIEGLKEAKLGAPIGTTSYDYITDNVQPSKEPAVYDTLNDGVSALKAKQIDGLVVDLPTAFFVTAVQVENGTIVGQFPAVGEQEYFGMAFEKDNPLVECVNEALQTLKDDGTLAGIQEEWLSENASAPVLE